MDNARTFTNRLADLLAREHAALGEFLVALSDFDRQKLWVELGYASLFDFLCRELGLSKASASFRKKAAELVQRFPETLEPIRDGRLCLSSVFELAKVLTPENRAEVLPRFLQLSKREAKAVAAALQPDAAPPLREMVTTVRRPRAAAPPAVEPPQENGPNAPDGEPISLRVVCPAKLVDANSSATQDRAGVASAELSLTTEPLTADLNRIHVTVSREFLKKLDSARAALSHSHPGASGQEILEAGLDLLLERHAKRKGLVKTPRREPPASRPDTVPAHVRRAVWERDGGRCQWPLESGGVCGSTLRLELDHVVPRAQGGPSTVENCRILCGAHNDLAARKAFGDGWMDCFTRGLRAEVPRTGPP